MRILILALFLVGCGTTFSPTKDREVVVLRFVITKDLSWLGLDTRNSKVSGYHHCNGTLCTIWLPPYTNPYSDCIWSHELAHIKYGFYHKEDEYAC